jgi:Ca-activated chloride channel family protein
MRDSAKSGSLNGMVMEYQLYYNDSDLSSDYEFTAFGIPHNNPLYSVGTLSSQKQEALDSFLAYCRNKESTDLAKKDGFDQLNYKSGKTSYSGADILGAQKLWKLNKDSGKDILAVFVADVSGSMAGGPLNSLKTSLTNAASYINENNYIGLVSYSDDVAIDLPLGKFDLNQHSYFQGAVESLSAGGGTASYSAVCTAVQMLAEAKKDHPDAKQMIFLLSDGAVNEGRTVKEITPLMKYYKIPVYTIAYGADADTDELMSVSAINEAACISASSDDVIYQLKQLFNAQM